MRPAQLMPELLPAGGARSPPRSQARAPAASAVDAADPLGGGTRVQAWLAYAIIVLQGFGVLCSWNVLINTVAYFKVRADTRRHAQTRADTRGNGGARPASRPRRAAHTVPLPYPALPFCRCLASPRRAAPQALYPDRASQVSFLLTAVYTYPQVPLLLLMVWKGAQLPLRARFLVVLAVQAVALAALPAAAPAGLGWALAIAFGLGCTTAVYQSSLYGLASVLPALFSQGVMFGMGLAGVLASVVQLGVQTAYPSDTLDTQQAAARIYYGFAAAVMVACAASFVALMRMPMTRYYMARAAVAGGPAAPVAPAQELDGADAGKQAPGEDEAEEERARLLADGDSADDAAAAATTGKALGAARTPAVSAAAAAAAPPLSHLALLRAVSLDAASVFSVFFITFVVFPSVAPFNIPYRGQLHIAAFDGHEDRWQLSLLLVFNIFDTIGRFMPGMVPSLLHGRALLTACLARVAFVVLFVGCQHGWPGLGDAAAVAIMAVFALTNGYFASLAMMQGPQGVREKDREAAGVMLAFWLQLGILVGSQVAFALV